MKYLHTMLRVSDLEKSLHFYNIALGFKVVSRQDHAKDKFTLVFLFAPSDSIYPQPAPVAAPMIELTYNWGVSSYEKGNAYGHMAYQVESIEKIQIQLKQHGYDLSWGPALSPSGNSRLAFIDDPDGYEIELLEEIKPNQK